MAPVGLFVGLVGLGLYLLRRPAGSPQLLILAWPALFGSLGVQFLRAASSESGAYGFWLCGIVFLVMAAAPLLLVMGERGAMVRLLVGDGRAEPQRIEDQSLAPYPPPRSRRDGEPHSDLGPVDLHGSGPVLDDVRARTTGDVSESLDRLSRLHHQGDLSDAEFAKARRRCWTVLWWRRGGATALVDLGRRVLVSLQALGVNGGVVLGTLTYDACPSPPTPPRPPRHDGGPARDRSPTRHPGLIRPPRRGPRPCPSEDSPPGQPTR